MAFLEAIIHALLSLIRPDMTPEQVEAALQARADAAGERLAWKTSVVDLLKVLDLPSGYRDRAQLAGELGMTDYTGTAEENIRLHAILIEQVAERDIKLPKVER